MSRSARGLWGWMSGTLTVSSGTSSRDTQLPGDVDQLLNDHKSALAVGLAARIKELCEAAYHVGYHRGWHEGWEASEEAAKEAAAGEVAQE